MKITSRNVNGIRAILGKWFAEWIQHDNSDIYCFQETKAFEHQIPDDLRQVFIDYDYCWHAGTRPGYAGTAIFWRKNMLSDVVSCNTFLDNDMFHEDGRITEITFSKDNITYTLLNWYFPNGWTRANGTEMLTYKLQFYDALITYIHHKHALWNKVIVVGDYNICHTEIDIARPKENQTSIWFLPIEREKVTEYLSSNKMIDVFRHFHPTQTQEYTWRSYRAWARANNVGRRIDYVTVSHDIIDQVTWFEHQTNTMWSDHCPVSVILS